MNQGKSPTYYLVAAIVWTVIALFALYVLLFATTTTLFAKGCGLVLIVMCVAGQWLRYRKMR